MKQEYSTAIDFYLESQKINPFYIHISSNSSSKQLINLRNHAYILNKLTLLNIEHPRLNIEKSIQIGKGSEQFEKQVLQLYAVCLQAVANNPMMPYKDYYSVKDLVHKVQHYYNLLDKLTYIKDPENKQEKQTLFKKKISLNQFWPRIRALLISIQEKIPATHQYIREYVTIRRGLLETDKKYFLAQMMAKKVQTRQLKQLIEKFQEESEDLPLVQQEFVRINQQKMQNSKIKCLKEAKMVARMVALQNKQEDWKVLNQYLESQNFRNGIEEQKRRQFLQYINQILQDNIKNQTS